MDVGLLSKLFGGTNQWQGPCTVILDGEVTVQNVGTDAIGTGGAKAYAPRIISGRVAADGVCLVKDSNAIVLLQNQKFKSATGEESVKNTLTVADLAHVIAIEFSDGVPAALQLLGLQMPPQKPGGSHSGTHTRPRMG